MPRLVQTPWLIAVVSAAALGAFSCSPTAPADQFEISIKREIQRKCVGAEPCTIRLTAATSFSWDTLYVFPYPTTRSEIETVLGKPVHEYTEFSKRFVFVLNGEIVHEESTPINVEHPLNGEVLFGDQNGPLAYDRLPASGTFSVERVS